MTPSSEDLLRARLHEVDDLQPPDDGFELNALRAGRERLKRRQAWTRGLVAAAAAVAVGVVALPPLTRLGGAGGVSGASSAASQVAAPQGAKAAAPSAAADSAAPGIQAAIVGLRATLARDYPQSFTSLVADPSTPGRVVLHLTADKPAAEAAVRAAFPPGTDVVTERSAFTATQCAATLARVAADRDTLTRQGYAVGSTRCNADGRVEVEVTNLVTAEQITMLVVRYADAVTVLQVAGVP